MASPFKIGPLAIMAIGALISGGSKIAAGTIGGGKRRKEERDARQLMEDRLEQYEALDTSNPYANLTNPYANLENTMEDLTVDQRQAQFEAQQGAQQRANIMQQMGGAAGGSGVAALAQAMANQGQLQTQQAAASIGQQERENKLAAARQGARLQQMEAMGEMQVQQLTGQGEIYSRQWEQDKVSTLLGMAQQRKAAATAARQRATNQVLGGLGTIGGGLMKMGGMMGGGGAGGAGASPTVPTNLYGLQQPIGEISKSSQSPYGREYSPWNTTQQVKAPWEE